jgi:transcriptional regulator with XRE-family HTH domain
VPITLKCLKPKEPEFEPRTLGGHLKLRRLQRKLSQIEAARTLEVNLSTILNWEKDHTKPAAEAMPALLQFLGYDPLPMPKTLPERLLAKRRAMGWSIREAARQFKVDPRAWRDWEQGGVILHRTHRHLVARLLGLPIEEVDEEIRTRWNRLHRGMQFGESLRPIKSEDARHAQSSLPGATAKPMR